MTHQADLFGKEPVTPLAERVRPETLDRLVGQDHLLGRGKPLREALEKDELFSMILWGPPGSGKTTLARIIARMTSAVFEPFSAVTSGIPELRKVIARAQERHRRGERTILFVDEIHRFNKAQQDAFLPHVEAGTIVFIGATTENPSFEVVPPLLSRCRVFVLEELAPVHLEAVLKRALEDERGLGGVNAVVEPEAMQLLVELAQGDARVALNLLELAVTVAGSDSSGRRHITRGLVGDAAQRAVPRYDKSGEEHYNLISALHKSLRDSDADASLYWLARMLEAGESPLYVARRMVRFASEDVGNADPQALIVSMAAMEAYRFLGSPEGDLALAQAAVYLATAPKSNAVYTAYGKARDDVHRWGSLPVPLVIRNAPTRLMKDLGYGKGYRYAHDHPDRVVAQQHFPDKLKGTVYYRPGGEGYEAAVKQRLDHWRASLARQAPNAKHQIPEKSKRPDHKL
jgi:putative ATPase